MRSPYRGRLILFSSPGAAEDPPCRGDQSPNVGVVGKFRKLGSQFRRREESPGSRARASELEESAKERDWDRDWSGKERKTMNAGGIGKLE
ncbi:hypothetical protein TNCV_4059641 [Trichonephila clavipes]|nr:hypothetical protein TNCV_4059641 [Trichonephila clavipes]